MHPPLNIITFFLTQLEIQYRPLVNIRTYQGGKPTRSSVFFDMTHYEFQCRLQMTGTYLSWLNINAENHIQTIEITKRRTRMDSGLPVTLWHQSTEGATEIYNILYYATLQDALDWVLDKKNKLFAN